MTFARVSATSFACAVLMMAAIGTALADKATEAHGTATAPKIINQATPPASSRTADAAKTPPAVSAAPALATPTTKPAPTPAPAPAAKAETKTAPTPAPAAKAETKPSPEPAPAAKAEAKPSSESAPAAKAETKAPSTPAQAPAAKSAEAAPADKPTQPPPKPTLVVDIDLTHQKLNVTERGKRLYSWSISSGREGFRTPAGTYRPQWMTKMWYSRKYEWSPMPHAIFFHKGYAIHGTYATRQLGHPASHGCVRLSPAHAATLYKLVSKHGKALTRISLRGTAPASRSAPQVAERRHNARPRDYYDDDDYSYYREARRRPSRRTYSDGSAYGGDPYYEPRRRYPPRYVERPYPRRGYWGDYE